METDPPAPLSALLIGIDGYPNAPLNGCVNDIRAVQRFLLDELAVPAEAIQTLLAPNSAAEAGDPAPELGSVAAEPTLSAIVSLLKGVLGRPVVPGERLLIYYSGHGSFQKVNSAQAYFEGLVPLDYEDQGLLFDLELNRLLQNIVDAGIDLSVILDCCSSGGATRDLGPEDPDSRPRTVRLQGAAPPNAEARLQPLLSGASDSAGTPGRYTVLCACHADEKATECRRPPRIGRSHGLMTATLLDILRSVVRDRGREALHALRFADVFTTLNTRVLADNPSQRPQLLGPSERRIFGGPWRPRDPGYRIRRDAQGGYLLDAGTLAGLSRGAELAVYGPEPDRFPALDSDADRAARLGRLTVTQVSPGAASAVPLAGGPAPELPLGARARLVRAGELSRLRVSALDSVAPAVRATLDGLQDMHSFLLLPPSESGAELFIGQNRRGELWLGDDLCGSGEPAERSSPGPMAVIDRALVEDDYVLSKCLGGAIRHYAQYAIPLRTYRNGGFSLPSKSISLRLINTKEVADKSQLTQQYFLRIESPKNDKGIYQIEPGDEMVIELSNDLNITLYAFVFLCGMDGYVAELGSDVVLQGRSRALVWYEGIDGQPFPMGLPEGRAWGIDRLIVLVTDQPGLDLSMLRQDETLQQMIYISSEAKSPRPLVRKVEGLRYVAQQYLVQIGSPG